MARMSFSAAWSGPHVMEVTHRDATKGKGLLSLCARLGLDRAQSFAIGDSGNDVPMLRDAGFSVAMGSAPDFVMACADAVSLPNTEDGAALAIERYVLGL